MPSGENRTAPAKSLRKHGGFGLWMRSGKRSIFRNQKGLQCFRMVEKAPNTRRKREAVYTAHSNEAAEA